MNHESRSVVISGAGLVCPLGQGISRVWPRMLSGDSVCEPIPRGWLQHADFKSRLWAPLPEVDFAQHGLSRSDALRFDSVSMLAISACHEALEHAGLAPIARDQRKSAYRIPGFAAERIGAFVGTGIGGINTTLKTHLFHALNRAHGELVKLGKSLSVESGESAELRRLESVLSGITLERRFNPLAVTMLMSNAVSAAPGVRFGITGPCRTTTLACASGTAAIGEAFRAVADGTVDLALAGASEHLYDDYGSVFRSYDITGALTHGIEDPGQANRPFDVDRRGFLFSEGGAAMVVLESAESARSRGITPLAEIAGYGESFDGHNLIAMDPSGAQVRRMIENTLAGCSIDPGRIDYVNAHGTGTLMNDEIELEVLSKVVREDTIINSTKGLIGHTIGASGAIEAVVTALSVRDGVVHPCNNLINPLREMNFPRQSKNQNLKVAMSQSFAFGGHNACLIMRRHGE